MGRPCFDHTGWRFAGCPRMARTLSGVTLFVTPKRHLPDGTSAIGAPVWGIRGTCERLARPAHCDPLAMSEARQPRVLAIDESPPRREPRESPACPRCLARADGARPAGALAIAIRAVDDAR